MARLAAFGRKPRPHRRLLLTAAALQLAIAIAMRVLPFGQLRRLLASPTRRPRRGDAGDLDLIAAAVRATAVHLPIGTCLSEALAAQYLFARRGEPTMLRFGVSPDRAADRPLTAHAWLERGGATVIGARAVVYDPLASPSRCAPSPLPR